MNKITFKIWQATRSRTVWTVVVMFLMGGFQNIAQFVGPTAEHWIMGGLTALAVYFHLSPSQNYSAPTV